MRLAWIAAAGLVMAAPSIAAEAPPAAAALLSEAQSTAAGQHKSVFLIFHASW